jgi:hypothetical protein
VPWQADPGPLDRFYLGNWLTSPINPCTWWVRVDWCVACAWHGLFDAARGGFERLERDYIASLRAAARQTRPTADFVSERSGESPKSLCGRGADAPALQACTSSSRRGTACPGREHKVATPLHLGAFLTNGVNRRAG